MIIVFASNSSAGSPLTQGKKKEYQLSVSHQAAAGHRATDEDMDLAVNGHRIKKDPQKEN